MNVKSRKQAKSITPDYLHNAGLYYLQRFAASRKHFEEIMMRKVARSLKSRPEQDAESCAAMVKELAAKFERSGLLDDAAYTRMAVASLRGQGRSKRFILGKLKQEGLPSELAQRTLERHDQDHGEDGDFLSALIFARKKKIGPFQTADNADANKALAKLARAGFSYNLSQKILKMGNEEAQEILGGKKP